MVLPGNNQESNDANHVNPKNDGPGGLAQIVSLGSKGWKGIGYRPHPDDATKPRKQQRMTISLIDLPASSNGCKYDANLIASKEKKATHNDPAKCKFVDYPDLPVTQYWNYDGENGALGYMNMERIGTTGTDVLVGYATKIKHKDSHFPPLEYRVAKISGTTGKVMMTKRLKKTGWGEEDHFKRTKDGCVLFPSVWNSAPGASYGNNGADGAAGLTGFSSKIRISKICDKAT